MIKVEIEGETWGDVQRHARDIVSAGGPAAPVPTAPRPRIPTRLRFSDNARRLLDHVAAAGGRVYASDAARALAVKSVKGITSHMSSELKAAGVSFDALIHRDWDAHGIFYELAPNMPPELRAAAFPEPAAHQP